MSRPRKPFHCRECGEREPYRFDAWYKSYWTDGPVEPPICGMDDGVRTWTHRLRCLGNAVVPQIVEMIGRAIIDSEASA